MLVPGEWICALVGGMGNPQKSLLWDRSFSFFCITKMPWDSPNCLSTCTKHRSTSQSCAVQHIGLLPSKLVKTIQVGSSVPQLHMPYSLRAQQTSMFSSYPIKQLPRENICINTESSPGLWWPRLTGCPHLFQGLEVGHFWELHFYANNQNKTLVSLKSAFVLHFLGIQSL